MAHVALRIAPARIAADAERLASIDFADHVAIAGKAGASRPATVAILAAQIAVHAATAGWLAHAHAGQGVGRAQAAAAAVARTANRAVHAVGTVGGARGRRGAGAKRGACRLLAVTRAAGTGIAAYVAGLNTERGAQLARSCFAQA